MTQKAIEVSGTIDAERRLVLDDQLPVKGPTRVRVIVILPDEEEIDEAAWLRAAAAGPAFEFLKDSAEDIYSVKDGRPFPSTPRVRSPATDDALRTISDEP